MNGWWQATWQTFGLWRRASGLRKEHVSWKYGVLLDEQSPAAKMPTSGVGGADISGTTLVTTAAASGPRDMELALPIRKRVGMSGRRNTDTCAG